MDAATAILKAKINQKVTSEEALGKLIGVSGVTVMSWRRKQHTPKPEHAQKLAELAGIDPAAFVAEMMLEQTKDQGLRATIEKFKRLVNAAAATLPALLVAIQQCILCSIAPPRTPTAQ